MAWFGLAVLVIATVFGAVDRQILVLLAEPMHHTLQLTDTQLGLLQGAGFSLFAGITAVPIGWLADRYGRRTMLCACVLVWSASTAACGLVQDFPALFLAAAGMGMGEAGLVPLIYGLIPEIVPERRRLLANGIYVLAVLLGGGMGIVLGGVLLSNLESLRPLVPSSLNGLEAWRLAFLLVAAPGPVVAALILMIRLYGSGGTRHLDHSTAQILTPTAYLRAHLRTLVSVFGGIGLGQLGLAATAIWLPVIAARSYGASTAQVGQGIGTAYMLGTVAGGLLGAMAVPSLKSRLGLATPIRVIVIGLSVAAATSAALLFAQSAEQLYVLFGVQMGAVTTGTLMVPTLLQDVTPPLLRSRAIATGTFVMVALTSLSPMLVGALSDALRVSPQGLVTAVVTVSAIGLVSAAVLLQTAQAAVVRTVQIVNPNPEPALR